MCVMLEVLVSKFMCKLCIFVCNPCNFV